MSDPFIGWSEDHRDLSGGSIHTIISWYGEVNKKLCIFMKLNSLKYMFTSLLSMMNNAKGVAST